MEKIIGAFLYIYKFISDPSFQDEQKWVKWLIPKLSIISPNVWTSLRFFGGAFTIILSFYGYGILSIIVFLLFALTDWVDGKVARYRKVANGNTGAILDGAADKVFVIPVVWYLGMIIIFMFSLLVWKVSFILSLAVMTIAETCGYFLLGYLDSRKKFKKTDKPIFEHLLIGKIKFFCQVVFVIILWAINYFKITWLWLPVYLNITLWVITVLAIFSLLCKIDPRNIKYFADTLTGFNILCGIVSIYLAEESAILSAGLIIIAAVFDFFDGFASRKFGGSKFGPLADDLGDFISFALAPAWLMLNIGIPLAVNLLYVLATTGRLIHFYFHKPISGQFNGFPSTACAVFIGSMIMWGAAREVIFYTAIVLSIMEIIFPLKWYHFRKITVFPAYIKISIFLVFALTEIIGKTSEAISISILIYFILFYQPVADRIWIKTEVQGV